MGAPGRDVSGPPRAARTFPRGTGTATGAPTTDESARARRDLADYVQAFAVSGQPAARFLWHRDGGLVAAALIRDQPLDRDQTPDGDRTPDRHQSPVRIRVDDDRPDPDAGLTVRELEVLTLVALGASNVQIAVLLVVSPRTVSTHVERILRKLDVNRRAAAAVTARERGLVLLPLPAQPGGTALEAAAVFDHAAAADALAGVGPPKARTTRTPRVLRLGSAFPSPDARTGDGAEMLRGATLAIEQLNAAGGVAGRRIEHVVVDVDPSSPDSVGAAMTSLLAQDVDAITVGFVTAWDAAYRVLAGTGIPFLNASTSEQQVAATAASPDDFPGCFQTDPTEMAYALGMVQLLDSDVCAPALGERPRTISIVSTDDPFSASLDAATRRAVAGTDWRLVELDGPAARTDAVVAELATLAPTLVVNTDPSVAGLTDFLSAFAAGGPDSLVHAFYAPSQPGFLAALGRSAEGLLWSTAGGILPGPLAERFIAQHQQRFDRPPGTGYNAHCYDQVQILATAWALAGGGTDRRAVAEVIRSRVHRGVCGSYYLDNPHQANGSYPVTTADPSLGMAQLHVQVQDGHHRLIAPAMYGRGVSVTRPPR